MIDSHAHVAFYQFDDDREAVLERANAAGVRWLEVGTNIEQSRRALSLATTHEGVWPTVGVHPSDIDELTEAGWTQIEQLAAHEAVVAIGEVGLDYYRGGTPEQQLPILEKFLKIALQRDLPIIFHVRNGERDAHEDLLTWLTELPQRPRGVIHTFSGTQLQAQRYLELGLYLSFSGVVTFKNAGEIAPVAQIMPLEKMLVETDCPFLAPEPYRGQRNEPSYVRHVVERIAALRAVAVEEVAARTEENTRTLFVL